MFPSQSQPMQHPPTTHRRNAVDYGQPQPPRTLTVQRFAPMPSPQRRNAVDYGQLQTSKAQTVPPRICPGPYSVDGMFSERSIIYRAPAPSPPAPPAPPAPPSTHDIHPYRLLAIYRMRSGHCYPPISPEHCAQCKAESFVETRARSSYNNFHVVADSESRAPPLGGPAMIDFTSGVSSRGALLTDILTFVHSINLPGEKLLRHTPGPLKVTLAIKGFPPVKDILLANCAHRMITNFSLVWWLAEHLRILVEKRFGGSIAGLELINVFSEKGETLWVNARYPPS
ncbi:hypothetical protein DFH09DRAFT_623082 [Mycena vulgaris]|nr:hypothetical protein DFH09DRAFT_623082 [Mycena vulgaris]